MDLTTAIRIMAQAKVYMVNKPGNPTWKHFDQARKIAIETMKQVRDAQKRPQLPCYKCTHSLDHVPQCEDFASCDDWIQWVQKRPQIPSEISQTPDQADCASVQFPRRIYRDPMTGKSFDIAEEASVQPTRKGYKNPVTGEVFEDIDLASSNFCVSYKSEDPRNVCNGCPLDIHIACWKWCKEHPEESAKLMGYEIVEVE